MGSTPGCSGSVAEVNVIKLLRLSFVSGLFVTSLLVCAILLSVNFCCALLSDD